MLNYASYWPAGLGYEEFLTRHGTAEQRNRWAAVHAAVSLSSGQREVLEGFRREMKVLCLAGAWCGDCVNQCPIFDHFARASACVQIRYFDRDVHAELSEALRICGGARVPVVVFLSEDDQFVGLYGDRTLAAYRQLAVEQLGSACPTGIGPVQGGLLAEVTQDWLDEFERVQLLLRTSPRLRQRYGD